MKYWQKPLASPPKNNARKDKKKKRKAIVKLFALYVNAKNVTSFPQPPNQHAMFFYPDTFQKKICLRLRATSSEEN